MKLLCLNVWGGRQGKTLFNYVETQANNTDIFCFQEVFNSNFPEDQNLPARVNLLAELKNILPGFTAYYSPAYNGWLDERKVDFEISEGNAIFIKNNSRVLEVGSIYIYGDARTEIKDDFTNEPKVMQWAKVISEGGQFLLANAHGKWYPGEKLDTPERIRQSEVINSFLKGFECPKILCGDFNLMPQTQSVKMLEQGMLNLIKEFKIKNTRNEISWQQHSNKQYFADYIFTSPGIKINSLEVPYNKVSDHLPMILDAGFNPLTQNPC